MIILDATLMELKRVLPQAATSYPSPGIRSHCPVIPAIKFLCIIITPLGLPVDPLVYITKAISVGTGRLGGRLTAKREMRGRGVEWQAGDSMPTQIKRTALDGGGGNPMKAFQLRHPTKRHVSGANATPPTHFLMLESFAQVLKELWGSQEQQRH